MLRHPVRLLPYAGLLFLGACDKSTKPTEEFIPGKVVATVQKFEPEITLKLEADAFALQLTSALDPSRAYSFLFGGTAGFGGDTLDYGYEPEEPIMELFLPGRLAPRGYTMGSFDPFADEPAELFASDKGLGVVSAVEPDGDDIDFFSTSGGTVEVVQADPMSAGQPGRVRARLNLALVEMTQRGPGKRAKGTGTVDGPVWEEILTDADLTLAGAITGRTDRELLEPGGSPSRPTWNFPVSRAGGTDLRSRSWLTLQLARIPATGETVTLQPLPFRGNTTHTDVSGVMLVDYGVRSPGDTLPPEGVIYQSTGGALRVESVAPASSGQRVLRGTLAATLAGRSLRTGQPTGTSIQLSGRVGLVLDPPRSPIFGPGLGSQVGAARVGATRMLLRLLDPPR